MENTLNDQLISMKTCITRSLFIMIAITMNFYMWIIVLGSDIVFDGEKNASLRLTFDEKSGKPLLGGHPLPWMSEMYIRILQHQKAIALLFFLVGVILAFRRKNSLFFVLSYVGTLYVLSTFWMVLGIVTYYNSHTSFIFDFGIGPGHLQG